MKLLRLTLVLALLCTGCGTQPAAQEDAAVRLGVVLKTMDSEHWLEIRSGMEQAAQQAGAQLILTYPSSEQAAEEQRAMLEDMLETDIDALIAAPCDSFDTAWFSEAAAAKGIPVFLADTRGLDCDIPYIGSDNRLIGRTAAGYLAEALPAGSRVAAISGSDEQASLRDRVQAFRDFVYQDGRIELARVYSQTSSAAAAMETAAKIIARGNVDGIFCTSAVIGMGAAAAKTEAGSDIVLIAVDTQNDALKAVQTGSLNALITQSGYSIGQKAVEQALHVLEGGTPCEQVYIPSQLLTKDNIDAYLRADEGR